MLFPIDLGSSNRSYGERFIWPEVPYKACSLLFREEISSGLEVLSFDGLGGASNAYVYNPGNLKALARVATYL